eukprot:g16796.t1
MSDGRWYPSTNIRPTPDYKELAKPLRLPPDGFKWRRLEDGAWELMSTAAKAVNMDDGEEGENKGQGMEKKEEKELGEEKESGLDFLEHVVMPDDTLAGICIKYKVKDRELRRLNGFVGDLFRTCDVLIIPNRFSAGHQPTQRAGKTPVTRDDMIQIFRKESQLGPQEARFYLETNAWDLAEALAEWHEENRWEIEQAENDNNNLPVGGDDPVDVSVPDEPATSSPPRLLDGTHGSLPGPAAGFLRGDHNKVKLN